MLMFGQLTIRSSLPSSHARIFVRTLRQPQRSTGPKCKFERSHVLILSFDGRILAQEGEFRVLQLNTSKNNRNEGMKKRTRPQFKEVCRFLNTASYRTIGRCF